ncbi:MAG: molybdenum cofactor guanylyltransferase, partial [Gemmatimonadaceae bacterium]
MAPLAVYLRHERIVAAASVVTAPCTGVILAGGQASRYGGRPKGLERVHGERVIDRVAAALRAATDSLLLVANDPQAPDWLPNVRVERDVLPDIGSLGGIHAALVHAGTAVIVVAWDMPFVPAALLAELRARGEDADVVAPESSGSRHGLEPLCAYYSQACIRPIERALDEDERSVIGFFDQVRVARLTAQDVRRFGNPERLFMNVNTPDEL